MAAYARAAAAKALPRTVPLGDLTDLRFRRKDDPSLLLGLLWFISVDSNGTATLGDGDCGGDGGIIGS